MMRLHLDNTGVLLLNPEYRKSRLKSHEQISTVVSPAMLSLYTLDSRNIVEDCLKQMLKIEIRVGVVDLLCDIPEQWSNLLGKKPSRYVHGTRLTGSSLLQLLNKSFKFPIHIDAPPLSLELQSCT